MTPAETNSAMNPPRPLCMACDSNQDECSFGVTIRTRSCGTSSIRCASRRAMSVALVNWFSI